MNKTIMFLGMLAVGFANAQQEGRVGINADAPKATLDVKSIDTDEAKGILTPQLTGDELKIMTANLTEDQHGLITFAKDGVSALDNASTNNVQFAGYHRFSVDDVLQQDGSTQKVSSWVRLEPSGLEKVKGTGDNVGWRLVGNNNEGFAPIGNRAIDMSFISGGRTDMGASGSYAISLGANNKASNWSSITIGEQLISSGKHSFAGGLNSKATNNYSFAYGYATEANGVGATVFGQSSKAIGNYSFTTGLFSESTAPYAIAMGYANKAKGEANVALGASNDVSGTRSVALGNTNKIVAGNAFAAGFLNEVKAPYGIAIGFKAVSSAEGMIAIGSSNTLGGKLFVIGNGNRAVDESNVTRSDAFSVLQDGRAGIDIDNFETTVADAKLQVNGAIKVSSDSDTCNVDNAGTIRFKDSKFQGCTGTDWKDLHN